MKLKQWVRFVLTHDTTWHGQFRALSPLLLNPRNPINRTVVDVGANDGFYSSNSYPFVRRGWRALLIEPHPGAFSRMRQLHAGNLGVEMLNLACSDAAGHINLEVFEGDASGSHSTLSNTEAHPHSARRVCQTLTVTVTTLEALLEERQVSTEFGLLSIETEGHDYHVLLGMNLARFRPRVIITEKHSQEERKHDLLRNHGYRMVANLEYDTVWSVQHAQEPHGISQRPAGLALT